jgi:hypothetical protein
MIDVKTLYNNLLINDRPIYSNVRDKPRTKENKFKIKRLLSFVKIAA